MTQKPIVLKYDKIDASCIMISSSTTPKHKGTSKFIPLTYSVNDKRMSIMYMQTSNLIVRTVPFRIRGQWYIDLTIPSSEEDFFQSCHDITERAIDIMTYTGAGSKEELQMMMSQWIMTDQNKMDEPYIRLPLSTKKTGEMNYQICKRNKSSRKYDIVDNYEFEVGDEISCLVRLQGLLVRPSSFKLLWKIDQIRCNERKVYNEESMLYDISASQHEIILDGPAFQESDDEDDAGMQSEYEALACVDGWASAPTRRSPSATAHD